MQLRTVAMPRALSGLMGLFLLYFAFRYGMMGLLGLFILPLFRSSGAARSPGPLPYMLGMAADVLVLAGIVLGAGIIFNFRSMALRVPGFSSSVTATRNLTWGAYIAAMIGLAIAIDVVIPGVESKNNVNPSPTQYAHVTATVADDGSESYVVVNGDLTVDLSRWPQSEWAGLQFKTSNPSVLSLDAAPAACWTAIARVGAHDAGLSRIHSASAHGRHTFHPPA